MLNRRSSKKKKLIYRIGSDAGFFSEFNCMVLAIAYCLSEDVEFILNSNYANFKYKKGWKDYFIPFTKENTYLYNANYNYRAYKRVTNKTKLITRLIKKFFAIDYFTQDICDKLWTPEFINKKFLLPGEDSELSLLQISNRITNSIWQLKPAINNFVEQKNNKLKLPAEFVGFHIRRGDKHRESALYDVEKYFKLAEEKTNIRTAFIASDDYRVLNEAKQMLPSWDIYSQMNSNKIGYDQELFNNESSYNNYLETINLLADVDLLLKSTVFIGSSSSNVGMFIGMKRLDKQCFYVDSTEWKVWYA